MEAHFCYSMVGVDSAGVSDSDMNTSLECNLWIDLPRLGARYEAVRSRDRFSRALLSLLCTGM